MTAISFTFLSKIIFSNEKWVATKPIIRVCSAYIMIVGFTKKKLNFFFLDKLVYLLGLEVLE